MRTLLLTSLLLLSFTLRPAQADPLVVTDGSLFAYWDAFGSSFQLSGENFHFGGSSHTLLVPGPNGARVGQPTSLSGTFQINRFFFNVGNARLDGVGYGPIYWTGALHFVTPTFIVPTTTAIQEWTTSFTMNGTMTAWDEPFGDAPPRFTVALIGSGIANAPMVSCRTGTCVDLTGVGFDFDDPFAAPEPATMLLAGFGLLAIARRRRG